MRNKSLRLDFENYIHAQYLNKYGNDNIYLKEIQEKLETEVRDSADELVSEVEIVGSSTRDYVQAKLTQNLFKALRVTAEKELMDPDFELRPRQSEEEEEGEEEGSEKTTAATSAGATTSRPSSIIPQVANLVKAIFGGNSINITSYVQQATKFLPPSVGNQFLGVVKLLAHNPSARWTTTTTTTTTLPPPTSPSSILLLVKTLNETLNKYKSKSNATSTSKPVDLLSPPSSNSPTREPGNATTIIQTTTSKPSKASTATTTTTTKPKVTTEEDEDEEEEETGRQLKLPDFSEGINALGSFLTGGGGGSRRPGATVNATTESASGFEEETTKGSGIDLREVASGIRAGLGDLIKVAPDLFKGAREAIGLLSGIQSLLGSFGN